MNIISLVEKKVEVDPDVLALARDVVKLVKSGKIDSIYTLMLDKDDNVIRFHAGWNQHRLVSALTYAQFAALRSAESSTETVVRPEGEEDEED